MANSLAAAHNLKVTGSNPVPATKKLNDYNAMRPASPRGFCMPKPQVNNRSTKSTKLGVIREGQLHGMSLTRSRPESERMDKRMLDGDAQT